MMKITNLKVKVEGKLILGGIDLEVNPGEVVVVMGPNGSGKSTLAYSIAGHPKYETTGKIIVDGKNVLVMTPDKRALEGIFLANQYPMAVPGLTVNSFLWQIYKKRIKYQVLRIKYKNNKEKQKSILEFRNWLKDLATQLDLKAELLTRGLNDGFSGGEKKKLEILQMLVCEPKYIILDEIDSGLDVDALRTIALNVAKVVKEQNIGLMVITHYSRILKYIKPDRVIILDKGLIVQKGSKELIDQIETKGYSNG